MSLSPTMHSTFPYFFRPTAGSNGMNNNNTRYHPVGTASFSSSTYRDSEKHEAGSSSPSASSLDLPLPLPQRRRRLFPLPSPQSRLILFFPWILSALFFLSTVYLFFRSPIFPPFTAERPSSFSSPFGSFEKGFVTDLRTFPLYSLFSSS